MTGTLAIINERRHHMQKQPIETALASAPAPAVNTAPQTSRAFRQEKKGPRLWLWIPLAAVGGLVLLVGLVLGLLATHHYPTVGEAAQVAGQ